MLDYRHCGPHGEPRVVHVDQGAGYPITTVAPDFASFLDGLVAEEVYDTSAADRDEAMITVQRGVLSPHVRRALAAVADRLPDGEAALRRPALRWSRTRDTSACTTTSRSLLVFDTIFWHFTQLAVASSYRSYLEGDADSAESPSFERMIIGSFTEETPRFATGGYSPDFVRGWWDEAVRSRRIIRAGPGYRLAPDREQAVIDRLADSPS